MPEGGSAGASPCRPAVLLLVVVLTLPGCLSAGWPRGQMDFGDRLQPNITKSMLVARINANVDRVQSWQATDVKIGIAGAPIEPRADIAVQWPRGFRLRATSIRGEEADIGSNNELLWFWVREGGQPEVVTVRHEDVGRVQLPIPFQPDWLMEVMGVVRFDETQMTLHPVSANGLMSLIAEGVSPNGQPVTRIIDVEPNFGLVVGHRLYGGGNQPIATATLKEHRRDRATGAILPHVIEIDWPQARTSMRLRMSRIEINPPALPSQLWEVPTTHPQLDLSRRLPRPALSQLPPGHQFTRPIAIPQRQPVVTAQFQEPPWDQSAIAAAGAVPAASTAEQAGRARVTSEQTQFLPPQQTWRPAVPAQPGRARLYRAF